MKQFAVGETIVSKMSIDACLTKDKAYVILGAYNNAMWVSVNDDRGVLGDYQASNFRSLNPGEDPVYETAMRQMQLRAEAYDEIMLEQEMFEQVLGDESLSGVK